MSGIALVFGPFIVALAVMAPFGALVACAGIAIGAASATSIQIWFRTQAKRSHFRRRQTSSRVATVAEALSSCSWAGTGALAAAGSWLAVPGGVIALAILGGTLMVSPARE
jgi:ABC-2 type transport system permease protein